MILPRLVLKQLAPYWVPCEHGRWGLKDISSLSTFYISSLINFPVSLCNFLFCLFFFFFNSIFPQQKHIKMNRCESKHFFFIVILFLGGMHYLQILFPAEGLARSAFSFHFRACAATFWIGIPCTRQDSHSPQLSSKQQPGEWQLNNDPGTSLTANKSKRGILTSSRNLLSWTANRVSLKCSVDLSFNGKLSFLQKRLLHYQDMKAEHLIS